MKGILERHPRFSTSPELRVITKVTLFGPIPNLEIVFDDGEIQSITGSCLDKILEAVR